MTVNVDNGSTYTSSTSDPDSGIGFGGTKVEVKSVGVVSGERYHTIIQNPDSGIGFGGTKVEVKSVGVVRGNNYYKKVREPFESFASGDLTARYLKSVGVVSGESYGNVFSTSAYGNISAPKNTDINGVIMFSKDGEVSKEGNLTEGIYSLSSIPREILVGDSVDSPNEELRVILEGGGFSIIDLDEYQNNPVGFDFGNLGVKLADADGSPSGQKVISIGSANIATESDGEVSLLSSGEQTVEAVGNASETVEVIPGGTVSSQFQFAGVRGKVASPVSGPINGVTVVLLDPEGTPVAVDETDIDGNYSFPEANINTDYTVRSGPFERDAPTEGQGEYTTRNLPQSDEVATLEINMTDSKESKPSVGVDIISEQFISESDRKGIGKVIGANEEITAIVAQDDERYENTVITEEVGIGEVTEVDIQLERKSSIGGAT